MKKTILSEKENLSVAALVLSLRAIPRSLYLEVDDMDGRFRIWKRKEPGTAEDAGSFSLPRCFKL